MCDLRVGIYVVQMFSTCYKVWWAGRTSCKNQYSPMWEQVQYVSRAIFPHSSGVWTRPTFAGLGLCALCPYSTDNAYLLSAVIDAGYEDCARRSDA